MKLESNSEFKVGWSLLLVAFYVDQNESESWKAIKRETSTSIALRAFRYPSSICCYPVKLDGIGDITLESSNETFSEAERRGEEGEEAALAHW